MPQQKNKLSPTVIGPSGASLRKPAGEIAEPADGPGHARPSLAATPVVRQPTAIPGTPRKRIDVAARELERLSPGAPPQAYEQARELVGAFVVDKATERKAILWAHDLQKSHSDLVTERLVLSRSAVLRKVEGYLGRTIDILGSIDLMAACGHGTSGPIGRLFQGINARIDTPDELAEAQAELERLVALMGSSVKELLDVKNRLLVLSERTEATGEQVEAAAIAALFLSQHLGGDKSAVAQRFAERAMSLAQTLALIRQGGTSRDLQMEQPIRMVAAIQNVALVTLPEFIGSIATITTLAARKRSVSPTDAGDLAYRLRDIIDRLKT